MTDSIRTQVIRLCVARVNHDLIACHFDISTSSVDRIAKAARQQGKLAAELRSKRGITVEQIIPTPKPKRATPPRAQASIPAPNPNFTQTRAALILGPLRTWKSPDHIADEVCRREPGVKLSGRDIVAFRQSLRAAASPAREARA